MAILLTAVILLSMLPVMALAEENPPTEDNTYYRL
jgi:hypothetical protein